MISTPEKNKVFSGLNGYSSTLEQTKFLLVQMDLHLL